MSVIREIWGILTPWERRGILAMQVVSLLTAVSTVSGIAAIAPFFAVLGDPSLIGRNALLHWLYVHGDFTSTRAFVAALGIGFIAIVLLSNLIGFFGTLAMHRLVLRIGGEIQTTLFAEYLSRPYAFHAATNSASLLNNILYETARLSHGILRHGFTLITSLVTASLIVLAIMLVNPLASIVMLVGLGGGYLLIYLGVRNRLLRIGQSQSRLAREQTQIVNEGFGAIKEILILQVRDSFRDAFERASRGFMHASSHAQLIGQSPRHIMECVAVTTLVAITLGLRSREGGFGLWLGSLTFLAFAAYRLLPTLQQIFLAIVRIRADRPALSAIAPDLRRARAALSCARVVGGTGWDSAWNERPRRQIELKSVSYRYAPDRPWAVRDVSLRIPPRAVVGIVGANGSGKSTLVDLMAGLLVPTSGAVEIDGCVLDERNRAAWHKRIAYVPQSIFVLDTSIARNIALGATAEQIDRQRLHDAARLAQLDEFVMTLPLGYEQRVGERGVAVSGGQRQRIGIARALYRDANLLLLDEATNALDGLTERELVLTLGRLRGRYTIVVIAHRMSTVRACDAIFHLAGGQIVGSGTYEELWERSEGFRRMAGAR